MHRSRTLPITIASASTLSLALPAGGYQTFSRSCSRRIRASSTWILSPFRDKFVGKRLVASGWNSELESSCFPNRDGVRAVQFDELSGPYRIRERLGNSECLAQL